MGDDISKAVGSNIRAEMARRGITQARVADLLGISQPQVSQRLLGRIAFDVVELTKVAALVEVPVADLLTPVGPDADGAASRDADQSATAHAVAANHTNAA